MNKRNPTRDVLWTAFWTTLIVIAIIILYGVAEILKTPLGTNNRLADYVTAVLFICVAGGFLASTVMFVWIGVREYDKKNGLTSTPFYIPQLIGHILFLTVTAPGGITSVDRLYHHDHPTWTFFRDAEVGLLIRLLYLGILIVSFSFTAPWVVTGNEDQRRSWQRVITGFAIWMTFLILVSITVYEIGGQR